MGRPHQAGALDQGGGRNSGRARQKGGTVRAAEGRQEVLLKTQVP